MSSKISNSSQSERKRLSQELQFLGQMASTETALFHQLAAAKNGITITDSKTVTVLMQEGAMTAGELAIRLGLTSGAVTSVIDRLEVAKLVHRLRDEDDRRKVIITLDTEQLRAMAQTYESMGASFQKLLATYNLEQLRFLIDYYKATIKQTKAEIQKLSQS